MVWDLIDDNKFPEPDDDNGRILYLVFASKDTQYDQLEAAGAHGDASDFDFPADTDHAWVGWVDYMDFDSMLETFTHELVEMIMDPEPFSGWTVSGEPPELSEIADICFLQRGMAGGHAVAAYYSDRLKACVVPGTSIQRSVRLEVKQKPLGVPEHVMDGFTTMKKSSECFHGTYGWSLWAQGERAEVTATFPSFVKPDVSWTVNGETVFSFSTNVMTLTDNEFDALGTITTLPTRDGTVSALVSADGNSLSITIAPGEPSVRLQVVCIVKERLLPDGYHANRKADVTVVLSGSIRNMDARYGNDLNVCVASRIRKAKLALLAANIPPIDHGDPIPPWVDRELGEANVKAAEEARVALSLAIDVEPIAIDLADQLRGLAFGVLAQARAGRTMERDDWG